MSFNMHSKNNNNGGSQQEVLQSQCLETAVSWVDLVEEEIGDEYSQRQQLELPSDRASLAEFDMDTEQEPSDQHIDQESSYPSLLSTDFADLIKDDQEAEFVSPSCYQAMTMEDDTTSLFDAVSSARAHVRLPSDHSFHHDTGYTKDNYTSSAITETAGSTDSTLATEHEVQLLPVDDTELSVDDANPQGSPIYGPYSSAYDTDLSKDEDEWNDGSRTGFLPRLGRYLHNAYYASPKPYHLPFYLDEDLQDVHHHNYYHYKEPNAAQIILAWNISSTRQGHSISKEYTRSRLSVVETVDDADTNAEKIVDLKPSSPELFAPESSSQCVGHDHQAGGAELEGLRQHERVLVTPAQISNANAAKGACESFSPPSEMTGPDYDGESASPPETGDTWSDTDISAASGESSGRSTWGSGSEDDAGSKSDPTLPFAELRQKLVEAATEDPGCPEPTRDPADCAQSVSCDLASGGELIPSAEPSALYAQEECEALSDAEGRCSEAERPMASNDWAEGVIAGSQSDDEGKAPFGAEVEGVLGHSDDDGTGKPEPSASAGWKLPLSSSSTPKLTAGQLLCYGSIGVYLGFMAWRVLRR